MSSLIKSGQAVDLDAIRPVPQPNPRQAPPGPDTTPREDPRLMRLSELEALVHQLRDEAAAARDDARAAFAHGRSEGIRQGLEQAESLEAERIAQLSGALLGARARFDEALVEVDRLAAWLARSALDKLFGETDGNGDRVCALLRHQFETIERAGVVEVAVSGEDFPDTAIGRVRELVGSDTIAICRDPDLHSGSCILRPRLGEIDIGLQTQWQAVGALLDQCAQPRVMPC